MRILLHTGKGGVGKTTVSATTGIAAARRGYRTLVLSTDPAHSLADVLGTPIGPDPDEVPGVPGLFAAQVDTRIRLEQAWSAIRQYLVGVLAARGMAEVQAEELTELPGAEEVLALLEVRRHAESGRFDAIVVDCAPSGETLRLLALPETIAFYAGRLMATPRRVLRSVAASLVGAGGVMPNGEVRDAVGDLLAELTAARTLLCDPHTSSVRLVLTPERVVLAEARRLHTALTLHGYAVDGVVVNRVLPRDAGGRFLAGWRAAQRVVLHDISESFGAVPVHRIPMTSVEPVGTVELAALADGVFARRRPAGSRCGGSRDERCGCWGGLSAARCRCPTWTAARSSWLVRVMTWSSRSARSGAGSRRRRCSVGARSSAPNWRVRNWASTSGPTRRAGLPL